VEGINMRRTIAGLTEEERVASFLRALEVGTGKNIGKVVLRVEEE